MKIKKQNRSRNERRNATKRHEGTLRELLDKASIVLEKGTDEEKEKGLQKLNIQWKHYCKKYYERNKREFPNVHAFAISIGNHVEKEKLENNSGNMKIVN